MSRIHTKALQPRVSKISEGARYATLLKEIKARVAQAQTRAVLSVNAELVRLYWDIGRLIATRQQAEGWGTAVIPRLARALANELPEEKGFSERNLKYMIRFYREYAVVPILQQPAAKLQPQGSSSIVQQPVAQLPAPDAPSIVQQPVALLPQQAILPQPAAKSSALAKVPQPVAQMDTTTASIFWSIPWGHHVSLMEKIPDRTHRLWYMTQTLAHGWSRNILSLMISNHAHLRQGHAITNFREQLPPAQSDLAIQLLKDPYIFDFLTLEAPFHERELETHLLQHVQQFLLELGQGFALVGRQFHIQLDGQDFYIDLLFYHLLLRCFIVIDLKAGDFKAEHAGKMNFYLNVIDDKFRHASDAPSIGLILCQKRNRIIAEYALRGMKKPIGISQYELTRALPPQLRSSLPTIQQIEAELASTPPSMSSTKRVPRKTNPRTKRRRRPVELKRKKK